MVTGTSHHGWPVAEKAIREPASSTAASSRSQRRGIPVTVPLVRASAGVTLLAAVTSGTATGLPRRPSAPPPRTRRARMSPALATAFNRFQEAQDRAGSNVGPLRLWVMPGLGHHHDLCAQRAGDPVSLRPRIREVGVLLA